MIKWFKKLFSSTKNVQEPLVLIDEVKVEEIPTIPDQEVSETKRGRKKTGITKTDIKNMSKIQLEDHARKKFGVELDRRRTKDYLIDAVIKLEKL